MPSSGPPTSFHPPSPSTRGFFYPNHFARPAQSTTSPPSFKPVPSKLRPPTSFHPSKPPTTRPQPLFTPQNPLIKPKVGGFCDFPPDPPTFICLLPPQSGFSPKNPPKSSPKTPKVGGNSPFSPNPPTFFPSQSADFALFSQIRRLPSKTGPKMRYTGPLKDPKSSFRPPNPLLPRPAATTLTAGHHKRAQPTTHLPLPPAASHDLPVPLAASHDLPLPPAA